MKFALLGADGDAVELAVAVAARADARLIGLFGPMAEALALPPELSALPQHDGWEMLVSGQVADAVIVGRAGAEDERMEWLRKLVQAGVPLLVAHPILDSMLLVFELDMIRQESRSLIVPYVRERLHPALAKWAEWVARPETSTIGAIEQVNAERALGDRSRTGVLRQLARDVEIVRALTGEQRRVAAMVATADEPTRFANLGVQLSGSSPIIARWSVVPADDFAGLKLTLVGQHGKSILLLPENAAPTLSTVTEGQEQTETFDAWRPADEMIERFISAIGSGDEAAVQWRDACRDAELVEAVVRSVERGRTVDLFNEEASEQGTFKGMMAAGGCLLLVLAMLVTLAVAIVAPFADQFKDKAIARWPHALVAILGLFLLLQLFYLVFRSAPRGDKV